jgi:cation:H+ antiporter
LLARRGKGRIFAAMLLMMTVFLVSIVAVSLGADALVAGASRIATRLGVTPLIVGLTLVAFGTSAPELIVSVEAAWKGQPGLAVGNVMGSTAANVGLIIGLGALIRPLPVKRRLALAEAPLVAVVLLLVLWFAVNGYVGTGEGISLLAGFVVYVIWLVRKESKRIQREPDIAVGIETSGRTLGEGSVAAAVVRVTFGLAALLVGGSLLVESAIELARVLGVTEEVIGATLVAVGTSVPELASTLAAIRKGLGDIALGNVLGSNVFNLGLVFGCAAIVAPLPIGADVAMRQVVPALLLSTLLVAFSFGTIGRWKGLLLLGGYAVYILRML